MLQTRISLDTQASLTGKIGLQFVFRMQTENLADLVLNIEPNVRLELPASNHPLLTSSPPVLFCGASDNLSAKLSAGVDLSLGAQLDIGFKGLSYKSKQLDFTLPSIGPFQLYAHCWTIAALAKLNIAKINDANDDDASSDESNQDDPSSLASFLPQRERVLNGVLVSIENPENGQVQQLQPVESDNNSSDEVEVQLEIVKELRARLASLRKEIKALNHRDQDSVLEKTERKSITKLEYN